MTEPGTDYRKPLPEPTAASLPFWAAAKEHRLLIQRSRATGTSVFYPRAVSPFGATDELEWVEASGKGHVYSFTVARRPTAPQWAGDEPYVIAIVELDEGPRLTTNIVGCPVEAVQIGLRVEAAYDDVTPDITLVKFKPSE